MRLILALLAAVLAGGATVADAPAPTSIGPFDARFLEGGIGIDRRLDSALPALRADGRHVLAAWVRIDRVRPGPVSLLLLGDGASARRLLLIDGRPAYAEGDRLLMAPTALVPGQLTHVAARRGPDGAVLSVAGASVAQGAIAGTAVAPRLAIAPPEGDWPATRHFGGLLLGAGLRTDGDAAPGPAPDPDLAHVWAVGVGWPFQKQANTGLWQPQDPATLPRGRGATRPPVAHPVADLPALEPLTDGHFRVNGWQLAAAPEIAADGAQLSRPGAVPGPWLAATVPGTVLTTLVDRGVYPDPYYGLDNLAIPERLARQDWWYRTEIAVPPALRGRALALRLNGANYAAEVWANGQRLGGMTGAFIRGDFALPADSDRIAIAIRVSPPPHPGIPHEQSIAAGVGENGGQLAIDGPTFVATEGWDWIPGIRDRDTGLWQDVELLATGPVRLGDPQVITDLPLPRLDSADVRITLPLHNLTSVPQQVTVRARFAGVSVAETVTAPPGDSDVVLTAARHPALHLDRPRLWWPNGYGEPALYDLALMAEVDGRASDSRQLRFGVRELSYELSLFDAAGRLRRVEVDPADAQGTPLVDGRHAALKQTPLGWTASLTAAGEASPAVRAIAATYPLPHLAIRVNGVRIAARGGNWGMDDAMKRSSRARLEPYFRLHRAAHLNIIRNWMGNNDEPAFYDLADENGLLVLNDFWQSTQDFQIEPQDPQLFMANAADVIRRYRHHPSILLWFGRNEGMPYPLLNEGLARLVNDLDGTRLYLGSSNVVGLQGSGPYNYRPPEGYFTDLAAGFSVEVGTPSLSTRDALAASIPKADRWPLSDTLAYHDWHFGGNGDSATFMAALTTMFGPPTGFADFERKAQLMNLETHKAMFEGLMGHIWTRNSGRLLWMTHPAWPSNSWQIYSSDSDTHAAYYGVKAATEPLHIQLNRPEDMVVVTHVGRDAPPPLTASAEVFDLAGRRLLRWQRPVQAAGNAATPVAPLPLADLYTRASALLVRLQLRDGAGRLVSHNDYWRAATATDHRAITAIPPQPISTQLRQGPDKAVITARNTGRMAAIGIRLTLVAPDQRPVLPAIYSDNYLTLLPGEQRTISVDLTGAAPVAMRVRVDGGSATSDR